MPSPFRALHHVCLVVEDIDASTAYYERIGIGPWNGYPPLSQYARLDVPNPDAFAALRFRYADLDNVQIQLCQPPLDDCPQRRFLDSHGEGVFQLGFEAPLDTSIEQAERSGLDVLMSGRRDDGTGFAYFDTLETTGVAWLVRQSRAVQA